MILLDPVAAELGSGIPARTIQRWVTSGWLKRYGEARRLLVDLDEVHELAEKRPHGRLRVPHAVA